MGCLKMKKIFYLFCLSFAATLASFSATFVVRNTNDAGDDSFRAALQAANANPGADVIEFAILPTDPNYDHTEGYWTIEVQSTLPTVTDDSLTIDGFSQHVMNPEAPPDMPLVVITGYGMTQESHGLLFWGAYNSINSVCIGGFRGPAIWIKGQYAHDNSIEGCFLGVYPDGVTGMYDPDNPQMGVDSSRGVFVSNGAYNNTIGGTQDYMRNIICNMYAEAILIEESDGNVVQGNYIGVAKDGVTPLGNGWIDVPRYNIEERKLMRYPGVHLATGSSSNRIGGFSAGERNVICASGRAGIRIEGDGTESNIIAGNYLGVGADGRAHNNLGNAEAGLKIQRGARYNTIGGEEEGAANVIAGNGSSGLQIREDVSYNTIAGNLIGVAGDGATLAPNAHNGIYIFGQSDKGFPQHNEIGPGNVIIANGAEDADQSYGYTWAAVRMDSAGTAFNSVFGNWLGTNKTGDLGSEFNSGVILGGGAHDNVIGPENTIANNKKYGVWIRQGGTIQNKITANSYANNERLHIFLSDGGNTMLEAPKNLFVDANSVFGNCVPLGKVELYIDDGQTFVDSVFADANGDFIWNGQTNDAVFLATVTDPAGNSSEFSASVGVPVELSAFRARPATGGVLLTWRTETETNNLGFYLQRGPDFRDIVFIPGHGTTASPNDYSYFDKAAGDEASYRLRQVDFDGATSFSEIVAVSMSAPQQTALHPPYPNPFNGETAMLLNLVEGAEVVVEVFNIRGEKIADLHRGRLESGSHRLVWNGASVSGESSPSGLYLIRASIDGTKVMQQKAMYVR